VGSLGITVTIAGRTYRLTVDNEAEEEMIRKASSEINEKVKVYSQNYSFKDQQDLLAMVCLEIASKKLSVQSMDKEQKLELIKSLEEINSLI
jgi:cell division protein ZapA (FtsZ GTPase activity inhibitor)